MEEKVLWFTATWCGPCRAMAPVVEEAGFLYEKVDIDESTEVADAYRVLSVPTFVRIDTYGNELARTTGAKPKKKLLAELFGV